MDCVLPPSLQRRDQRAKGEQYVRGLLTVEGRKSMRSIATLIGGSAAEQSMHHFISASTWDWKPVREALAHYLHRTAAPRAWVVQPLAIPKLGDRSVGVESPTGGAAAGPVAGQYAHGVWFASEELSVPVNWRLFLSNRWTEDPARRRRAGIPAEVISETREECAAASVLEAMRTWQVPVRPVVFDVAGAGFRRLITGFDAASVPLLARTGALTVLEVAEPSLPGYGAGPLAVRHILESVKGLRRPVEWTDHRTGRRRTSLVVAVPVTLPEDGHRGTGRLASPAASRDRRPLLVVGEWQDPKLPPAHIWLTGMTRVPVHELLHLTKLGGRVAHDAGTVGGRVGLRDFEGRSFDGWHRHMTLASVAHAVTVLSRGARAMASVHAAPPRRFSGVRPGRRPVRSRCGGSGAAAAPAGPQGAAWSPAIHRRGVR
ncbi:IS701 family transposase [Streptomyces chattanoogensis]|uniref:IS701 family transposase n=1 Tax=Streptomyces chattanoogensis TaxID=66876 RepID=UPI003CCB85DE